MKEKIETRLVACGSCGVIRAETERPKSGFYGWCPVCETHTPRNRLQRKVIISFEKKSGGPI